MCAGRVAIWQEGETSRHESKSTPVHFQDEISSDGERCNHVSGGEPLSAQHTYLFLYRNKSENKCLGGLQSKAQRPPEKLLSDRTRRQICCLHVKKVMLRYFVGPHIALITPHTGWGIVLTNYCSDATFISVQSCIHFQTRSCTCVRPLCEVFSRTNQAFSTVSDWKLFPTCSWISFHSRSTVWDIASTTKYCLLFAFRARGSVGGQRAVSISRKK